MDIVSQGDDSRVRIAWLDGTGRIVATNAAWLAFAAAFPLHRDSCLPGRSYLRRCSQRRAGDSRGTAVLASGLRSVFSDPGFELDFTDVAVAGDGQRVRIQVRPSEPNAPGPFLVRVVTAVGDLSLSASTEAAPAFRLHAELSRDFIYRFELTPARGFTFISQSIEERIGYQAAEFYADPELVWKLIHPDDAGQLTALFDMTSENPHSRSLIRWRHRDGTIVWVEYWNTLIVSDDGKSRAVEGIGRDVTDWKRMESELLESRQRLETIMETVADGILVQDDQLALIAINSSAEKTLGATAAEIQADGPLPSSLWRVVDESGQTVPFSDTPIRRVVQTGHPHPPVTLGIVRRDGSLVWVRNTSHPLKRQGDTKHRGVVTSLVDVTSAKLATDLLKRNEGQLSAIVASVSDAIVAGDSHGRIVLFNPAAEAMFHYEAGEVIGESFTRLVPERFLASYRAVTTALQNSDSPTHNNRVVAEWVGCRKSGEEFPVEATVTRISAGDGDIWVVVVHDLTERIAAERQHEALERAEKLRAVGQMASGVAHDLNQYLGIVAGYSELGIEQIKRSSLDSTRVQEILEAINRAAMDGAETVRRLLTFGRPKPEGAPVTVDFATLLIDVAKLTAPHWRDAAQAQGRPINLHVASAGDVSIMGWPAGLREALTNLVFNAVDALPNGGQIWLDATRREHDVLVTVRDDGAGMSVEVQRRAFEPFFSTKGERGTGLGLSMVYGIVERHKGRIDIVSTVGAGTAFHLCFPIVADSVERGPEFASAPALTRLKVLTVDDEPQVAEVLSSMLSLDGHQVTATTSAEDALDRLARDGFDLVISDLGLGTGMNGWELCAAVHRLIPTMPFVLATGWGAQIDRHEAREKGVLAVLSKPYRIGELRQALLEANITAPLVS